MTERKSQWLWILLLLVPSALAVLVIVPGLGKYGEGLIPEILGGELLDTEQFAAFAVRARYWAVATVVLSFTVSLWLWALMRIRWHGRLRTFDHKLLLGFRAFLRWHVLCAVFGAVGLAMGVIYLAGDLTPLTPLAWIFLGLMCAVAAGLQFLAAVFGVTETRRLYRGR